MRTSLLTVLSRQAASEAQAAARGWRSEQQRTEIGDYLSKGGPAVLTNRFSGPQSMLEALDPDTTKEWALRTGPARWHVTGRGPLVGVREHHPLNACVQPWVAHTGAAAVLVPRPLVETERSLAWCKDHSLLSRADEDRLDSVAVLKQSWETRLRPAALWVPELHGSQRLADVAAWHRAVRMQEAMVAEVRDRLQVAVTATHALRLAKRTTLAEVLDVTPTRVSQIKRSQKVIGYDSMRLLEALGLDLAPAVELSTLRERAPNHPLVEKFKVINDPLQLVSAAQSYLRLRTRELQSVRQLRAKAIRAAVSARVDEPASISSPISHRRIAALLDVDVSWVHRAASRA